LGDPEYGIWSMGLAAGLIHDIPRCEDLVRGMEREAEEMMGGMSRHLKSKL